ncbi:MAG: alpha/beta fold hydrolase [Anaerolineales bacterium]|jgi:carboxylesterase|nr:alpha/beta fold hydrolase [Anaerolineales bacterium]
MIQKNAEPFFFPGGPVGCLLVHGFTGTPNEMRWLGEYLAAQGQSVLGVRLAGHATCLEDMQRTSWKDWLACVEDGYHLLSGVAQEIYVIGLSLGGILSLTFASGRLTPDCSLAGAVAMATPQHLWFNPLLSKSIGWISRIKPIQPKQGSDWHDPIAEQSQLCYSENPLRQVAELQAVLVEMNNSLPEISCPVKLIYSRDDQTVRPEARHAELIYEKLGSRQKELIWIEGSGHVLTRDLQRETVFSEVANFVRHHSRPSG